MSNKVYEKALYLYNNGKIEKAIEVCEKEISRDLLNSKVLNLKGLLLYLRGDLEDAIALWRINKDYNNDEISSTYLKDAENDFYKLELYEEAKDLIENLYITEAIDNLIICSESDFNTIKVNNALAICYLKKGENLKVKECIDKVFKLDRNNKEANLINKKLGNIYKYKNKKGNLLRFAIVSLIISISIIGIILKREDIFDLNSKAEIIQVDSSAKKENEELSNNKIVDVEKEIKALNILNDEEVKENYIKAADYYEEGKYEEATKVLEYTIYKEMVSHLDDDIIFLLATSYEADGNIDKAIENYNRYISDYKNGSYIQEIYYRAALLYKSIDIEKSKEYANEIIINYPNSIYNNSYIKEIMKL